MKKYALAAIMIAFGTVACSSNSRVAESERNRATSSTSVDNDRRAFEDSIQARLDKIDREIAEYKDRKADAKTARAKRAYDRRIDDLEKLRDDTKAKYGQMKNGTNENWEHMKADVSRAMDNLEAKWNEFTDKIKQKS